MGEGGEEMAGLASLAQIKPEGEAWEGGGRKQVLAGGEVPRAHQEPECGGTFRVKAAEETRVSGRGTLHMKNVKREWWR